MTGVFYNGRPRLYTVIIKKHYMVIGNLGVSEPCNTKKGVAILLFSRNIKEDRCVVVIKKDSAPYNL